MATYLQFAGRHENPITTSNDGHKTFGTWNNTTKAYEQSTTLQVSTPNYALSNGVFCGEWLVGQGRRRGFAAYTGPSGTGDIPDQTSNLVSIGCLNFDDYYTAAGDDWTPYTDAPRGFYAYDGTTQSTKPGNASVDGAFTLIFLSNIYRGESSIATSLRRVIYKAAVGSLGAVATRLINTGGSGGGNAAPPQWAVTAASSDEQTVGSLLASGYGVLLDNDLINCTAVDG